MTSVVDAWIPERAVPPTLFGVDREPVRRLADVVPARISALERVCAEIDALTAELRRELAARGLP